MKNARLQDSGDEEKLQKNEATRSDFTHVDEKQAGGDDQGGISVLIGALIGDTKLSEAGNTQKTTELINAFSDWLSGYYKSNPEPIDKFVHAIIGEWTEYVSGCAQTPELIQLCSHIDRSQERILAGIREGDIEIAMRTLLDIGWQIHLLRDDQA